MLNRVTESLAQLEKLEEFARQFHALPLYLLYNHSNTVSVSYHWHLPEGGFRRVSTGVHACPELAHSAHALPSPAPSGFRLGPQGQTGQAMALCFRLSVRRERTPPNGVSHSAALP